MYEDNNSRPEALNAFASTGALRGASPAEVRSSLRDREEFLGNMKQAHEDMREMLEKNEDLAKFVSLADKLGWFHIPRGSY